MLAGEGGGAACTRPGPNTLLGRPTLFEFRGKLKESFRRRGLTDGRNVGEMRKSGRAASFVGARRGGGGKRRTKSRTSRFRDFRFLLPTSTPLSPRQRGVF